MLSILSKYVITLQYMCNQYFENQCYNVLIKNFKLIKSTSLWLLPNKVSALRPCQK